MALVGWRVGWRGGRDLLIGNLLDLALEARDAHQGAEVLQRAITLRVHVCTQAQCRGRQSRYVRPQQPPHARNSSLAAKPQEARALGKSLHEPARYDFHGAGGGTAGLTATREDTAIELQLRYERDSVPHDEPHTNEATKQRSNEAIERGSEEQQSLL